MLLELTHDMIGNGKAIFVRQPGLQATHNLAGADQGEGDGVAEVSPRVIPYENITGTEFKLLAGGAPPKPRCKF